MSLVITGSVLAETVFSWPGIGRLVYDSISKRDTPMVTGAIIMCSILMCIINLVVDLIYAFFDRESKLSTVRRGDNMAQASEIKKQYKKRTLFQETWRRLTKNRGAMLGLAFLVLLVLAAALSQLFSITRKT